MRNQRRRKHCLMPECDVELKPRKLIRLCPSCRYSMGMGGAAVGVVIGLVKWLISH